jgi:hypothetical protein
MDVFPPRESILAIIFLPLVVVCNLSPTVSLLDREQVPKSYMKNCCYFICVKSGYCTMCLV